MSYNFLPYAQDQQFLLPPSLHEWVREESLERFISDVVDHLDAEGRLALFYTSYRTDGWGAAAYHPVMMVKILLYGYAVGVRSSRRIGEALERDIAFRFLAANQNPDFRTIADFRRKHLEAFDELFGDVVELCREAGLVKLGRVAVDGRKVKGNAAVDRNRTRKWIDKEVREILEEAERIDAEEDEKYGPDQRGDELPKELRTREGRLQKLKEARQRLLARETEQREQQAERIRAKEEEAAKRRGGKVWGRPLKPVEDMKLDSQKVNLTDFESQLLHTRKGWVQGYNGQIMVDTASQVIVAQHVTNDANDLRQLKPLLEGCEVTTGRRPDSLVADAGYSSESNLKLGGEQTELFIATMKGWQHLKELRRKGPPRGRIPKHYGLKERMTRKLRTKRGAQAYKERGQVEAVFGQMAMRELNSFLLRGRKGAGGEWALFSTTHNLLKLWRSNPRRSTTPTGPEPAPA